MEIEYSLWPIWCDYLEEQGQDTELLRYYMTWGCFIHNSLVGIEYKEVDGYGFIRQCHEDGGVADFVAFYLPRYEYYWKAWGTSPKETGNGTMIYAD